MQVIAPLFLASLVAGHGHITNIVINGVSYEGWDIDTFPYESDPPTVVAWGTPNTGNGFISPGKSIPTPNASLTTSLPPYEIPADHSARCIRHIRYHLS